MGRLPVCKNSLLDGLFAHPTIGCRPYLTGKRVDIPLNDVIGKMNAMEVASEQTPAVLQHIELLGDVLQVRKEVVQGSEVVVRKEVITEMQVIEVPVMREELIVTRQPLAGEPGVFGSAWGDNNEIRIQLRGERVRIEKDQVVLEEVVLKKRVVTAEQNLTGTARREELVVDRSAIDPGETAG